MRYLSLFSGIEAATAAWVPLGWECVGVAEIEPFPCAVLKHHYPDVPNLGDITKITQQQIEKLGRIDLVVGGFPCQDLSVAGLRKGLTNADGSLTRSGLFYTACQIVTWANPRWTVIENVPGLFSSNGGRDFASVVGELAGAEIDLPREGWRGSGVALGRKGLVEWVTLDAQFVRVERYPRAVPQRRRRVFLIRDSGNWSSRPPLFLNSESLCGHPAPSRSAGKGLAPTLSARTKGGGGLGTDFDCDGGVICAGTGQAGTGQAGTGQAGTEILRNLSPTLNCNNEQPYVAGCLNSAGGHAVPGNSIQDVDQGYLQVVHSLRADGFDASEDGTGRGTPLVAQTVTADMYRSGGAVAGNNDQGVRNCIIEPLACFDERQVTSKAHRGQCDGNVSGTQHSTPHTIAFSCKDHGGDAGEVSPTLRSMGRDGSHANGGGQVAVAFDLRGREDGAQFEGPHDTANIRAASGGSSRSYVAHTAVRRLTPRECERLQGFSDDFTRIPWNGWRAMGDDETPESCREEGLEIRQTKKGKWRVKDVDGPRYKALGNSMGVNVMRHIGDRIASVESIK